MPPIQLTVTEMISAAEHEPSTFPFPYSQDPLAPEIRNLLIPIALFGTISLLSTVSLVSWITYRLCSWRSDSGPWIGRNQYVVLVYNLLLADVHQALAFFLNWYWYGENRIVAPHRACFGQAYLLSLGDVSSGFFVAAIAGHTYFNIVYGKKLSHATFVSVIIGLWALSLLLSILGPAIHGNRFFADSGVWCWISQDFGPERLYLHYLWIFMNQFGTIAVYIAVFLFLRKRISSMPDARNNSQVEKASRAMILYPTIYVLLTLPLAAGRMASLSGIDVPPSYLAVAACAMTSCGWLDCITYTFTRRSLIATELRPRRATTMISNSKWKDSHGDLGSFTTVSAGQKLRDELRDMEDLRKSIPPARPPRSNRWLGGYETGKNLRPSNIACGIMGRISPQFGERASMEKVSEVPPKLGDIKFSNKVEITITPADGSPERKEIIG